MYGQGEKRVQNKSKMHWIVAVILCGTGITAIGLPVMTGGVFITPIANELGVYRGTVSMHNTLTMLMKAFMSLYASVLLRKYPLKGIMATGLVLGSLSNYLMGWVGSIWLLNILGTTRGIGTGMLAWVPVTIIINEWFEKRHGLVMSIILSFSSIGGAIFTPIFTQFIENYGWAFSYRLMGIFMLLCSLPAVLVPYTLNPRDSGYLPYGSEEGQSKEQKKKEVLSQSDQKEFSTLVFVLLFIFILFQTMVAGIPQHFPGFTESIGMSIEYGATMLSIAMISSVLFKIGMGYISDQIGPVNSTISILSFLGIASLVLLVTEQEIFLYSAAFLFGGIFAIPSVSITLLTKEFFGKYNFTRLYPIFAFSTSLGAAVALSVVGFIFDFTGSYLPAFMISVGINTVNILMLIFMSSKVKSL